MAAAVHRVTKEYRPSVHTPDLDPAVWLILFRGAAGLADVAALRAAAVPGKYWQIDGDRVVEMDQSGKDAVDAQFASDVKASAEQAAQAAVIASKGLPALDVTASDADRLRALEKVIFGA